MDMVHLICFSRLPRLQALRGGKTYRLLAIMIQSKLFCIAAAAAISLPPITGPNG
jgi:hypothetical protein